MRRHEVKDEINRRRLLQVAEKEQKRIVYCFAQILEAKGISRDQIYGIGGGKHSSLGDSLLAVVPGAPIILLTNKQTHKGLVNGAIGTFRCFQRPEAIYLTDTNDYIYPPQYAIIDFPGQPGVYIEREDYMVKLKRGQKLKL